MSNWWHIRNWFRVGNKISWRLNFYTLGGFLYLYKPFKKEFFYKCAEKKHAFIISSLERDFKDIIDKYRDIEEPRQLNRRNTVWTLWWQGLDSAPTLVKACICEMKKHADDVVVITKDNINDYIKLPDYILKKHESGVVSFAQLSDIIRFTLLKKYGGLWLDSTIYLSNSIPERAFKDPFFSLHTHYEKNAFVQHNLYHGFVIGSAQDCKLVSFVRDMFFEYWKRKDVLIDYLMIDYLIMIAYRNFDDIRAEIDNLEYTSERLYDLVHLLNCQFKEDDFKELMDDCTFSKLDWHPEYRIECDGKKTYYSYVTRDV